MKSRQRIFVVSILLVLSILLILGASVRLVANDLLKQAQPRVLSQAHRRVVPQAQPSSDRFFVTRSGDQLLLDGHAFRFSGANVSWLGLLQTSSNDISYPSHFMVDDALSTASFMGATVIRSHTLGISVGCSLCLEPTLNTFNATAFQSLDYALQSAQSHHLKVIIPLIDNWHYYHGGKHTFTDWLHIKNEQQFYTNPLVISDFEQYIGTILQHVNIYTGLAYEDDPTIMAWETGNELSAPSSWVKTISAYIKKLDPHHLVMDGNAATSNRSDSFSADLNINTVDIYTGHYYPPSNASMQAALKQTKKHNKAFIVGEYDWNTNEGNSLSSFLADIQHDGISGDLYWSLFPHADASGFIDHLEHYTLHYPGGSSNMDDRAFLLSAHAYAMSGRSLPTAEPPGAPLLTSIQQNKIFWRGAFGASTYGIERSLNGLAGPWTVICNRCATDLTSPWIDRQQLAGATYTYRIRGYTPFGIPGPYSNVLSN